jgi:parallel beta-helix repeat protein
MRTLLISFLFVAISPTPAIGFIEEASELDTVYWEGSRLVEAKREAKRPSDELKKSLDNLRRQADRAISSGPYSVIFKKETPPSGDKHDYMSFSRYWWPNPDTLDGLPYIRRDGEVNRKLRRRGDRDQIGQLTQDASILSLAYFFFEEEKYAKHATELIHVWFLNADTKMNPHMKFGQAVPGRAVGRGVGILDTRSFIMLLDSVALLSSSDHWDAASHQKLQNWFSEYLVWLRTSDLGKEEAAAKNNHGSWYAAQTSRIALFVGEEDVAHDIIRQVQQKRIPMQFESDGSQPTELARTLSLHYSFFNLEALSIVARTAESLDIDLWESNLKSECLRTGIDYLMPYTKKEKEWPYTQRQAFSLSRGATSLLRMASVRYQNADYLVPINLFLQRHPEHNFACLLFHAQRDQAVQEVEVKVSHNSPPHTVEYVLPDISAYSIESVIAQVPKELNGTAQMGPSSDEPYLAEAFRKDRGKSFQKMQGTKETQIIKVTGGAITLSEVAQQINNKNVLLVKKGIATLRLPILVQPGASLIIDGKAIQELRLSTERGAYLANAGNLYIIQTKVTSWDEQNSKPTSHQDKYSFRPFISSYFRSNTYFAGSTFLHLGYHETTAYGISLSSEPERHAPSKINDWPTGILVDNKFHGLYYGFYSFEARNVKIIRNKYTDCILYGIDPHDRSTGLIIAENITTGTKVKHGIIGSRGISESHIFGNVSYKNAGSGVMLDRQCTRNIICNNKIYGNGQGISIYESPSNIVADNLVVQNKKSGVRVRNSHDIVVTRNIIVANGDYGLEIYSKRLDDHEKRAERGDTYDQLVSLKVHENVVAGNENGLMKGMQCSYLSLQQVDTNPDMVRIEAQTGLTGISLQTDNNQTFGSGLKKHSTQLSKVFEESNPLVELRTPASPKQP